MPVWSLFVTLQTAKADCLALRALPMTMFVDRLTFTGAPKFWIDAFDGNVAGLKQKLEASSDPKSLLKQRFYSMTPMLAAAFTGQAKAVEFLLENGADVSETADLSSANAPGFKMDAGVAAVSSVSYNEANAKAVVQVLINKGYDLSLPTSAILLAPAYRKDLDMLTWLLDRGASPKAKDPAIGLTPYDAVDCADNLMMRAPSMTDDTGLDGGGSKDIKERLSSYGANAPTMSLPSP